MANSNLKIRKFFYCLFGRNSDPGSVFRRNDPFCNIPWFEGLKNQELSNILRSLQNTPYASIFTRTILKGEFDNDFIEAAIKTNHNMTFNNKNNIIIDMEQTPDSIRLIPILNSEDENCLKDLLTTASAWDNAQAGNENLLNLTQGKYKRVDLFRIMKTGSAAIQCSIREALLGPPPYNPCHKLVCIQKNQKLSGVLGKNGLVECSWNPLSFATKAFNFAHSHYPINEFHTGSNFTYSVISLRDPLDRICSFINSYLKLGSSKDSSNHFKSLEDFTENCHPDWIFGQLYFCSQNNKLKDAKVNLRKINRVLIAEESKKWSESLSSDLNTKVKISIRNKSTYDSKVKLKRKLESLISSSNELSKKLNEEYKLYEYAKELSKI